MLNRTSRDHHGLLWRDQMTGWAQLWENAGRVAALVQSHGTNVAMVLSNTPDAAASVIGGMRAGGRCVSLPLPRRGQDVHEYQTQLRSMLADAECSLLLVDSDMAPLFGTVEGVEVVTFAGATSCEAAKLVDVPGGSFVQFTSGTTGDNQGVVLTGEQLAANVAATIEAIGPDDRYTGLSWLPLSHDMGLVGMLLIPWCVGARLVLRDPADFTARPAGWIDDMSAFRAHVTAAPNFALDLVARDIERHGVGKWDLRAMRQLIVGAELIRPETLRHFQRLLHPYGLHPAALAPAYGMAEMGLAVAMSRPGSVWKSVIVASDGQLLEDRADHRTCGPHTDAKELVSCDRPLDGYTVDAIEGILTVDGPSRMHSYLGQPFAVGPQTTGDAGFVTVEGDVIVEGRSDDIIVTRGRKLRPDDLEHALGGLVRTGCVAAVAWEDSYAIVAERSDETSGAHATAVAVRRELSRRAGVAPELIVFVERGSLSKTSSGKLRRHAIGKALEEGGLSELHRFAMRKGQTVA